MDESPSSTRRKKSDKAKEKRARTPYSSQHVRQVVAAASKKTKHKKKFFVCFVFYIFRFFLCLCLGQLNAEELALIERRQHTPGR